MKKIIYIYSLIIISLVSCTKEIDYLYNESAEVRIEKVNNNCKEILAGSEFGWKGYYGSLDQLGAWPVLFNFSKEGNVDIKTFDIDIMMFQGNVGTIPYSVKTSQTTSLIFESYSIFQFWHGLKENKKDAYGNVTQVPMGQGEFQFVIDKISADRVVLTSLTDKGDNKTKLILEKALEEDWQQDKTLIADQKKNLTTGATSTDFFRNLNVKNSKGDVIFNGQFRVDTDSRIAHFDKLIGDKIVASKKRIAILEDGFTIIDSLKVSENKKIATFIYNKSKNIYESSDSDLVSVISYSNTPGIKYFPFVQEWGTKNGEKVNCTLDYSVINGFKGIVSQEFYDLCSVVGVADGLRNIDFYMNDTQNPSGSETSITLKYNRLVKPPYGFSNINVDIPVEVIRNGTDNIRFKLKGDYRKAYRPEIEYIDKVTPDSAKDLISMLTDEKGFYMLPDVYTSRYDNMAYHVVVMISVAKPEYRFVTEYLEMSRNKKK